MGDISVIQGYDADTFEPVYDPKEPTGMMKGATATEKSHLEDARHKNNNRRAIFGKYWKNNRGYCAVNVMGINTR